MKRTNRIKEIVGEKFGLFPSPTKALLQDLGVTINRFNHIVFNSGSREMDAIEIHQFAGWLEVPEQDLFQKSEIEANGLHTKGS